MEKPEHWEPWWDDEVIVFRSVFIEAIVYLVISVPLFALFLFGLLAADAPTTVGRYIISPLLVVLFGWMTFRCIYGLLFIRLLIIGNTLQIEHPLLRLFFELFAPKRRSMRFALEKIGKATVINWNPSPTLSFGSHFFTWITLDLSHEPKLVRRNFIVPFLNTRWGVLQQVLDYRIAKARHENPPPPEFL